MEYISLSRDPNQWFSLRSPNGYILMFELRYFRGQTFVSVTSSAGNLLCSSKLATSCGWLLPVWAEKAGYGNFRFEDDNDDYPVFSNFNKSCVLVNYTREEAEQLRSVEGVG